jgi:hypothetical protein
VGEVSTGEDVGGIDAESWEGTKLGAIGTLEVFGGNTLAISA